MLAHVAFEVAPLQLAPALAGAVMYWLRARTLRDRGTPVPENFRYASDNNPDWLDAKSLAAMLQSLH